MVDNMQHLLEHEDVLHSATRCIYVSFEPYIKYRSLPGTASKDLFLCWKTEFSVLELDGIA
jgi:hypothetical protein